MAISMIRQPARSERGRQAIGAATNLDAVAANVWRRRHCRCFDRLSAGRSAPNARCAGTSFITFEDVRALDLAAKAAATLAHPLWRIPNWFGNDLIVAWARDAGASRRRIDPADATVVAGAWGWA